MPLLPGSGSAGGGGQSADVYLAVKSARAGDIKGEARSVDHADEIVVVGWRWGLASNSDAALRGGGSGGVATRYSVRQLIVSKHLDRASTSLVAILTSNDKIKSARLAMRLAGSDQQDFYTIELTDARLTEIDYDADERGNVLERLTFTFASVALTYRVKNLDGSLGGASSVQVTI